MFRVLLTSFIILMVVGCSNSAPSPQKANVKAFEEEDTYIMFALRAEETANYAQATKMYDILYDKSDKQEYLLQSIKNMLRENKNREVITKIDKLIKESRELSSKLIRMKIIAFIQLEEFEDARVEALALVKETKSADDYILVGDIYIKEKKFEDAVKYLESAYMQDYNEKIADKLSIVLYVNMKNKKEAIALLETHTRVHGYSLLIGSRLLGYYSDTNNVEGLLSTYLRHYEVNKNDAIAKKIVRIYEYKKDILNLLSFLERSSINDEKLLDAYRDTKNYKKAYILADRLYEESGEIQFLADSAIFEYQSIKDKSKKKSLSSVVDKFEKIMLEDKSTLYLNYFGYLLIDHNIDIKKGIMYVKKALKKEPNSYFYLDSLAWGYYKLGSCKKAKKIMSRVALSAGGSDAEVIEHIKAIDRCNKKSKKGKKKR